jgi:transcriptional regulator with XRE-family HTH domain
MRTFGEFIARRRKKLALTQKELAASIVRDDGKPLSVQYLNDIEHGRRGAPPDYVIGQLAKLLRVEVNVLYFRAGGCLSTTESDRFKKTSGRRLPRASPGTASAEKILKNFFPTM